MAIQMEQQGESFYRNATERSRTGLGKALFRRLAMEEDFHAAKAKEIKVFLELGENPLAIEESLDRGAELKSKFEEAGIDLDGGALSDELETIQTALEVEERSSRFYEEQSASVGNEFERRFFGAIQQEEQGHRLILLEYRKRLTDSS